MAATAAQIPEIYQSYPTCRTAGGLSYVNIADEYVEWLAFANAGMLNRGNLVAFDHALRNLPPAGAMLEIGAFAGLSTNLLGYYRKKHRITRPFFNCDRWQFEGAAGSVGGTGLSHADYRAFVRESYVRNVRMFSGQDLPQTIELLSDEFFEAWENRISVDDVFGRRATLGGPLAFCYIDGNHSYEFARRDFVNTDRCLEPGGFILFDDSADGTKFEVGAVVQEISRRTDYRVVLKNPNYLFQKIDHSLGRARPVSRS